MKAKTLICLGALCLSLFSCDDRAGADSAAKEAKRARVLKRMDANDDGVVSPEEREQAQQKQKRVTKRFDANGDGALSDEERVSARHAIQEKRAAQAQ